jgi:hypothetical protein
MGLALAYFGTDAFIGDEVLTCLGASTSLEAIGSPRTKDLILAIFHIQT